jgi:hypothetical protein
MTKFSFEDVKFTVQESKAAHDVIERAMGLLGRKRLDYFSLEMDLLAVNSKYGLDLDRLLAFKQYDFLHDVAGIVAHFNRMTGELEDCFSPRCSRPRVEPRASDFRPEGEI